MKKRIIKVVEIYAVLLTIFIVYYFVNKYTGFYIPCLFREVTGYKCPGCGITHILFDIVNLNFKDAFKENPLVFIYLPFIVMYFIYQTYLYINDKKDGILIKIPSFLKISVLIIIILYGVIRNIVKI